MQNKTFEISTYGNMEVRVTLGQDNVTRAEVRSFDYLGDILVFGRGSARWNPIDHFDPEIGRQVALGRALSKYGKKLALFWEKQAVTKGEHKRLLKQERMGAVVANYFSGLYSAKPPTSLGPSEFLEDIDNIEGDEPAPRNRSQEPTMGLGDEENVKEGPDTIPQDLDVVVEENRKKLVGEGGQEVDK